MVQISELKGITILPSLPFEIIIKKGKKNLQCLNLQRWLPKKRLVFYSNFNNQEILAKIFIDASSSKRHWQRELKGIKTLLGLGIPTPELIDFFLEDGIGVIISKRIKPANTLYQIWKNLSNDQQREHRQQTLKLLANMHNKGIWQQDIHLGNILVSDKKYYCIDCDTVKFEKPGTPLSLKKSIKNLGLFFAQFTPVNDIFIQNDLSYYTENRKINLSLVEFFKLVNRSTIKHRKYRINKYLKKIFRECSEFNVYSDSKKYQIIRKDSINNDLSALLNDPAQYINQTNILKSNNIFTLAKINLSGTFYFVKIFFRKKNLISSWKNAYLLKMLGIKIPLPLGFVSYNGAELKIKSCLVSQFYTGLSINDFLKNNNKKKVVRQLKEVFTNFRYAYVRPVNISIKDFIYIDNNYCFF